MHVILGHAGNHWVPGEPGGDRSVACLFNIGGGVHPKHFLGHHETGWDLKPFAAVLAPGQMSLPATKYKEIIRD